MADTASPPVFIVSGGAGALGKHLARVVLAQFPLDKSPVILMPQVRTPQQLAEAVEQVAARNGVIIHTMVDPVLREALRTMAAQRGIPEVDTVGEALARLSEVYGHRPLGQPGLSHGEEEAYMERIKAIEFTVDHDDGRGPRELGDADVVLTGVSRVGKTPLSIYLSVLGWKVANVPLVPGIEPPPELFEIDRRRVVGLTIDVATLADHRRWRQRKLAGAPGPSYAQLERMEDELAMAKRVFRRGGFPVVDVSNKPVEESADEIIAHVTRSLEHRVKLPPVRPRDGA
jgi:hypothetical protein